MCPSGPFDSSDDWGFTSMMRSIAALDVGFSPRGIIEMVPSARSLVS